MEQRLTIHRDRSHLPSLSSFWNFPRISSSFWSPLRFGAHTWNENVEDLFDNMRWGVNRAFDELSESLPVAGVQPQPEVHEDQKSLRINMDLPGLTEEDIDISAKNNVLTISADKHEKRNGSESHYSFSYSTSLPESADIDAADVGFDNQRLRIDIPKKNGGRKLAINVENNREKKAEARREKA